MTWVGKWADDSTYSSEGGRENHVPRIQGTWTAVKVALAAHHGESE